MENQSFEIFCPSHAGHHLRDSADDTCGSESTETFGLDWQISHKAAFIHSILDQYNTESNLNSQTAAQQPIQICLIGHSIGAYMILKLLSTDIRIRQHTKHISLLMPFILWSNIPYTHRFNLNSFTLSNYTQRMLTTVIQNILHLVFNSGIVPKAVLRCIINNTLITRKNTVNSDYFIDILCNRLFTPRMVANFLHMGGDEIRNVPRDEVEMINILRSIVRQNNSADSAGAEDHISAAAGVVHHNRDDDDNKLVMSGAYLEPRSPNDNKPAAARAAEAATVSNNSTNKSGSRQFPQCGIHILYTNDDVWAPSADISVLNTAFNNTVNNCTDHTGSKRNVTTRANNNVTTTAVGTDKSHPNIMLPYVKCIHGLGHGFTLNDKNSDKVVRDIVYAYTSGCYCPAVNQDSGSICSVNNDSGSDHQRDSMHNSHKINGSHNVNVGRKMWSKDLATVCGGEGRNKSRRELLVVCAVLSCVIASVL